MSQIKDVLKFNKEWKYLGAFVFTIILVEVLLFNRGNVFSNSSRLEELHYSIRDGTLFQFDLENGKLVAQNNDPNLTFDNINLPIDTISIHCSNSIPGALGQVFYRNRNESFTELDSISYDPSLPDKTFKLPDVGTVSSLRFDLTNVPGDLLTCSEFVLYPNIPQKLNLSRLVIYVVLLLLSILSIFRNIKPIQTLLYMIRRNERIIFLSIISILILFRIWLVTGIPKLFLFAPHDDLYFAKMAHYIIHGQWMGPYSQMTLIKSPFYAFFLIYSFLTGLPLLLNETIFYVVACIILFFAFSPLIKNRWWRLLLFLLLLFCPASLATFWNLRVYREFVYLSLTLFVIAFSVGLLLRIERKLSSIIYWATGLGISMGAFMITREEGVWIYPILLFFLVSCVMIIWFRKMDHKWFRSSIIFSSIIIWYIPITIVSYINYSYYGFWGISENMDKDFNQVINTIGRIKTSVWYPYSKITLEGLSEAYRVSPRFAELKNLIEALYNPWRSYSDRSMESMPNWFREKYLVQGSETVNGHFMFLLRDALEMGGFYSYGKYPREYLREVADQLEAACNDGTIICYPNANIPLVGSVREEHIPIIIHFFFEDIYLLLKLEEGNSEIASLEINDWPSYQPEFSYFDEFVNNPIESKYYGESQNNNQLVGGKTDIRLQTLHYKEKTMLEIQSVYKTITLPSFVILCFGWLVLLVLNLLNKKRNYSLQALLLFQFLLGLLFSRVMTLSILSATTGFDYIHYGSSNYLFIYIFLFLIVFYLFDHITHKILDCKRTCNLLHNGNPVVINNWTNDSSAKTSGQITSKLHPPQNVDSPK